MKKILTILLVAVLAVGFAFAADFTGNATISAGYNLDNTGWGFANATELTAGEITLKLGGADVGSTGEGDIYAKIAGTYAINLVVAKTTGATPVTPVPTLTSTFEITDANIHFGEDLVVGILNAGGGQSYAASYYLKDGKPEVDKVKMGKEKADGFTVTYKDYTAGFGMNGNANAKTYKFFGQAQTPSYTLAEGVTLQAAAYGYLANDDKAAGAAVKGAYAGDAFTANLGVDFVYDGGAKVEAALKAAYAPVTLDVFYHNVGAQNLDSKIALALGNVSLYVDGRNLILDARSLEVGAKAVLDAVTVDGSFKLIFKTMVSTIKANVAYAHDMFTLKADTTVEIDLDAAANNLTSVKVGASISSDKLINKATVSLGWAGAEFVAKKYGAITASCKIEF